jgi:hypothetical protein
MVVPIKEEDLEIYKKKNLVCTTCGAKVTISWGGSCGHNCYVLRCANSTYHSEFMRPYETNASDLPGYNMPGISRNKEKELTTKHGEEATKALARIAGGNVMSTLTENQASRMAMILWPDAYKSQSGKNAIAKLALICRDYGLNPAMDHVFLVPFNKKNKQGEIIGVEWSVVRGIKASRLICGRERSYGYIDDTPRKMTDEEQTRIFGEVDADSLVAICKLKDKDGNVFTGYGKWALWKNYGEKRYPNEPQGTEKGNSKFNMACIRAERQALDKLNPGSMPAIDVVDEAYMPFHRTVIIPDGTKVNEDTGEILEEPPVTNPEDNVQEGVFSEVPEEPAVEVPVSKPPSAKANPPAQQKVPPDWSKITEKEVPDYPALEKIFNNLTKKQPKDMYAELGGGSRNEMTTTAWQSFLMLKVNHMAPGS